MWARLSDPGTYQAFQHFITHAPWDAETRVEAAARGGAGAHGRPDSRRHELPETGHGLGRASRGSTAARAARSRIARRRSPSRLWTGARAWLLGATLYLPEEWLTPRQRARAQIPATVRFEPKWRLALTLLRQVRAAGFTVTAVVGDAEFGDNATLRRTLHRAKLPYALGVSSDLKVFLGTPALDGAAAADGQGSPAHAPPVAARHAHRSKRAPGRRRNAAPVAARLVAQRHEPAVAGALLCGPRHARARLARADDSRPKSGCSANETWRAATAHRYYLVDLPATASLRALVSPGPSALGDRAAVSRTQGRNRPRSLRRPQSAGVATPCRVDGARLQLSPARTATTRQTQLTLPRVRAVMQEVLTAHFFMTQPHYLKWMLKLKEVELRN